MGELWPQSKYAKAYYKQMMTRPNEEAVQKVFNREVVWWSVGAQKNAPLVQRASASVKAPLENVYLFHTDRGSEFKNIGIDELLSRYKINRSLSEKGNIQVFKNRINQRNALSNP